MDDVTQGTPTEGVNPIVFAVRALARVCDGASTQDGMGFNGLDTKFGRSLAALPYDKWTVGRLIAAHKMLRKYRKQLAAHGIDYDSIEVPEEPKQQSQWRIYLDGQRLVFAFPFDYDVKEDVKHSIPGVQWDNQRRQWWAPVSKDSLEDVQRIWEKYPQFALEERIAIAVEKKKQEEIAAFELSSAEDADLVVDGLGGELRGYQRAGVLYASQKQRLFIADEMGIGKTVQALATLQHLDAWPAVVVCPASIKINWFREARKWILDHSIIVVDGPTLFRHGSQERALWIVNYEMLRKYHAFLTKLGLQAIVFDESHALKNAQTQRSKLARCLADGREIKEVEVKGKKREHLVKVRDGIPVRLLLTGTPILNRVHEFINQFRVIDRLEDLGGYKHIMDHYGHKYATAEDLKEFNNKLRQVCYIRRLKKDVVKELPGKQRATVPMPIDNMLEYKAAERDVVEYVREQARSDAKFEVTIADLPEDQKVVLREQHATEKAEKARRAKILVAITTLKQVAARGKLAAAVEWVEQFMESGEKLVFFAWHTEVIQSIGKRFGCFTITGETSLEARQRAIDDFASPSGQALIALNMKAGGTGIDGLQGSCSNVAFLELGWNDATHDQAESRLDRIGQKNPVNSWFLLAPDTIDEWIYELIEEKRQAVTAAADGTIPEEPQGSLIDGLIERFQKAS